VRRVAVLALFGAFVLVACGGDEEDDGGAGSISYGGGPKKGIATYYDADGSGNCSFDKSDDLDVVAMNKPEYAGSAACGACLRVKGPTGEVTVRVVDSCPGCESGHIDLSESAFAKIAKKEQGKVSITYETVTCPVSGNLAYHFKEGSSKFWTAIQVLNHRRAISKLEYKRGEAFVAMKRESYNYFVESKGVGDLPSLVLRVTAADGQVVEDTLPGTIEADAVVDGKAQFR
jgi:expansin